MIELLVIALIAYILYKLFVPNKENRRHKESRVFTYIPVDKTGKRGEQLVHSQLCHLEKNGAVFLCNLYIPRKDGTTTEIDNIMICSKGIFVFESKDYSGWIFGKENSTKWCQVLPTGRRNSNKEYFYNPIKQNKIHINALQNMLGESVPLFPFVVFSDRCEFKGTPRADSIPGVVQLRNLRLAVEDIYNTVPDVIPIHELNRIYNMLYPYTRPDVSLKIQHINNILEKRRSYNTQRAEQLSCEKETVLPSNCNNISEREELTTIVKTPVLQTEEQYVEADNKQTDHIDVPALDESVSEETDLQNEAVGLNDIKICPRCGKKLIKRKATWGEYCGREFWGCAGFPNCKYIENILESEP